MLSRLLEKIPTRYWALLALCVLAVIQMGLIRYDAFGLDEGAARGLLLNWSVQDQVINPIIVFGIPDFRALLFMPISTYWPGNLVVAKIFSMIITFGASLLLYNWSNRQHNHETALIATGLLLISPLVLTQIDNIGTGPYLLLIFSLGSWLNQRYRQTENVSGNNLFTQMLLVITAMTLHPAGLAYPLALAWMWYRQPNSKLQQKLILAGLACTTLVILLLRPGWNGLNWWDNPITVLANTFFRINIEVTSSWSQGLLPFALFIAVLLLDWKRIHKDLLSLALAAGALLGMFTADPAWALLVLTLVLYQGIPLLVSFNQSLSHRLGKNNFAGHRGLVFLFMVMLSTTFMLADRHYGEDIRAGKLSPEDQLISVLQQEAADIEKPFRGISQWPGRSMMISKRDVLPLPSAEKDGASFLQKIKGITHITFDPYDPDNKELARNISELGGELETMALLPAGVVLKIRNTD